LGQNVHFLKVVDFAKKIAESRSSILIMGESGTGKELFAQAIHNRSDRKSESFVALNCGAVPRTIIETELFGYEEGNLSGSLTTGNPGKFEIADGGTLFLDEIGELSLDIQARLLEVIEEGTVCRTGSSKAVDVDVRIIATSNRNLEEEVKRGNFRKDLYYRLNVLPLKLPALRHRKDDIPVLVEFFMQEISERLNRKPFLLSPQQMQQMMRYDWPGNIRELENFIELAINTETMPSELLSANVSDSSGVESQEILSLGEVQKRHILQTLARYNGNISLSAKALGIARNTLYRSIEVHGIDCSEFDAS